MSDDAAWLNALSGGFGTALAGLETLFGTSSTQTNEQLVNQLINSTSNSSSEMQALMSALTEISSAQQTSQQAQGSSQQQQQQSSTEQQNVLQQLLESVARSGTQTQTTSALGSENLAAGNLAVQQLSSALSSALGSDRLSQDAAIATAGNARDAAIQQVLQSGVGNIFGQVTQSGAYDNTGINAQADRLAAEAATAGAAQELATIGQFEQLRQGEIQGTGALLAQVLGQLTGAQTTSQSTFTEDTTSAQDSTTATTAQQQATASSQAQQQQQSTSETQQQQTTSTEQSTEQSSNTESSSTQDTSTDSTSTVTDETTGLLETIFG